MMKSKYQRYSKLGNRVFTVTLIYFLQIESRFIEAASISENEITILLSGLYMGSKDLFGESVRALLSVIEV